MKKILQFAGLAGLMVFALGVLVVVVQQKLTTIAAVHLVGGGVMFVAGVAANLAEIKEYLGRRSVRMGPQALLQAGILLLVLLLINIVASRHDRHFDTTDRQLYTLSPASEKVGRSLPGTVRVIASLPGGGSTEGRQRLQLYANTFPKFDLTVIDPDKNEDIARSEGLPPHAGAMFKYQNRNIWITKFDEVEITNALVKVTREFTPKVWFTIGHLEPSLKDDSPSGISQLAETLTMQGFELQSVDLSAKTDIPPDVSLVAIIGPAMPFSEYEIKLLDFYLSQGGKAVILLDPLLDPRAATGLEKFLAAYGVTADENIIFDPQSHLSRDTSGLWIIPSRLSEHPISAELSQPRLVFYMGRSLRAAEHPPLGVEIIPLISTSTSAYAKTVDLDNVQRMSPEESRAYYERLLGPKDAGQPSAFDLGLAVVRRHDAPSWKKASGLDQEWEMRMVVFGGASIARNLSFSMPFNYEILTNSFNWAAGSLELKGIAAKKRGGDRLILDENQMNMILYLSVLILPEMFMMVGLAVWWRKR